MTISRAALLKEILPGLHELFDIEYKTYERKQREAFGGNEVAHGLRLRGSDTQSPENAQTI